MNIVFRFLWGLVALTGVGMSLWACGDDDSPASGTPPATAVEVDDADEESNFEVFEVEHAGTWYVCFWRETTAFVGTGASTVVGGLSCEVDPSQGRHINDETG